MLFSQAVSANIATSRPKRILGRNLDLIMLMGVDMVTESMAKANCQNYQYSGKLLSVSGARIPFAGLKI